MILPPVAHLKPAARKANAPPPAVALRPHVFRRERDSAGIGAVCNASSAALGVASRHAAPAIVARHRWDAGIPAAHRCGCATTHTSGWDAGGVSGIVPRAALEGGGGEGPCAL